MTKIQLPSTTFTKLVLFQKGKWPSGLFYFMVLLKIIPFGITKWEQLAKSYCCILPDLPGTGASSDASSELSIADMADFIHEIAQVEQCSSFVLAGHSMGGYIALAYAEKYGSFLSGLGLIHSTAYADDDTKKENRLKSIRLIEGNENGKEVFLRAMVPNLYAEASHAKVASDMNRASNNCLEFIVYYLD
jgi:pimeloyl-ACP methyl ester carboxylesterase